MINLSYGQGRSQTGHIQVGFFSFIIRYVVASKHCRCVHVLARHGIWIRILPSCTFFFFQKTFKKNKKDMKITGQEANFLDKIELF